MTRTSTCTCRVPPIGSTVRSCKTRSSLTCISSDISPISSKKMVPPWANSKRPIRSATAPVKEPFLWPKSSLSSKSFGMAAQLIGTKFAPQRSDWSCNKRAKSSLPVPLSPVIMTVALELAIVATKLRKVLADSLDPINWVVGFMSKIPTLDCLILINSRKTTKVLKLSVNHQTIDLSG